MSKYRNGRAFEYKVRDVLKDRGYFVVRSAGSKSPADLIAINSKGVLLVQCKRSGRLGIAEWNQLYELAESVKAIPLMVEIPCRGHLAFWCLVAGKDGSRRNQPMEPYTP